MESKQNPQNLLIARLENRIKQKLFGVMMLVAAGLMFINSLGAVSAGNNTNTNLSFNVAAGALSLLNGPSQMNFPSQTYGTGNNVTGNQQIDALVVMDYRGTSTAWTVSINSTNLAAGSNDIPANKLTMWANNATIANLANGDTNQVAKGANGTLNGSGQTLLNGSTAASGTFNFDNGYVNLLYLPTYATGNYTATMTYTVA